MDKVNEYVLVTASNEAEFNKAVNDKIRLDAPLWRICGEKSIGGWKSDKIFISV